MASVTTSRFEIRSWIDILVGLTVFEGRDKRAEPEFCDKKGDPLISHLIEAEFHEQSKRVKEDKR